MLVMNDLTSIDVGHDSWHGAWAHFRQRRASRTAARSPPRSVLGLTSVHHRFHRPLAHPSTAPLVSFAADLKSKITTRLRNATIHFFEHCICRIIENVQRLQYNISTRLNTPRLILMVSRIAASRPKGPFSTSDYKITRTISFNPCSFPLKFRKSHSTLFRILGRIYT